MGAFYRVVLAQALRSISLAKTVHGQSGGDGGETQTYPLANFQTEKFLTTGRNVMNDRRVGIYVMAETKPVSPPPEYQEEPVFRDEMDLCDSLRPWSSSNPGLWLQS